MATKNKYIKLKCPECGKNIAALSEIQANWNMNVHMMVHDKEKEKKNVSA